MRAPSSTGWEHPVSNGYAFDADCDLCEAARITPWFHEDDLCWIAECEICAVPMVVWKSHDPNPPAAVKAELHARLAAVVVEHFEFEHYVDDNMRQIPAAGDPVTRSGGGDCAGVVIGARIHHAAARRAAEGHPAPAAGRHHARATPRSDPEVDGAETAGMLI